MLVDPIGTIGGAAAKVTNSMDSLPEGLHEEFLEWFQDHSEAQLRGDFSTPQPKKLTERQLQLRTKVTDSAKRQRAMILLQSRHMPGRGGREEPSDSRREMEKAVPRGPLTFPTTTHPIV